jgi:multidrug resistance efflux pump
MQRSVCPLTVATLLLWTLAACGNTTPPVIQAASKATASEPQDAKREVRVSGVVQAVHSSKILVPAISGNYNQMTLTHIVANGTKVEQGDMIASFDATAQMDAARDASAKFDDLGHQADQKRAQNRADSEKRVTDLRQAEADLQKARLELRKGPVLGEIQRLTNEEKARIAQIHVDSLKKSIALHDKADEAALRYLELQRERQKVAIDRAQSNIDKLAVKAPLAGMVAQEYTYRGNSWGHAQEGDQLYRGRPLVSIFDPSEMLVRCSVGEPDIAAIAAGIRAEVHFDAYPDLVLPAHMEFASPVASAALNSPIKTFTVVFRIDKNDTRLLPDLSAAVVVEPKPSKGGTP